jgi:hypothetical protein
MDFNKEEKAELTLVAQDVLTAHADYVEEHRDDIALGVALAAIHVARLDKLMLLAGEDHTPSSRDAVVNLLILFSPYWRCFGCARLCTCCQRGKRRLIVPNKAYTVRIPQNAPGITSDQVAGWLEAYLAAGGELAIDPGAGERSLRLSLEKRRSNSRRARRANLRLSCCVG